MDVAAGQSSALFELNDRAQAEILLQAALEASPDDARLYNKLGFMIREAALQYLE